MTVLVDQTPFGTHAPGALDALVRRATRALPDTKLGLRAAILLRRVTTMRLGPGPLDVEEFGLKLRLYPRGNGCEKGALFTPQMFEVMERRLIQGAIIAARVQGRPFVFVDIGANVGLFSLIAARMAEGAARVLAIEPQPGIRDRLAYNIAQNPGLDVRPLAVALAERDGEVELFIDARDAGGSRIGGRGGEGESVRVRARPLAEVLTEEGFEGADLLKIDVEGGEDLILGRFLKDAPDAMLPRAVLIEDSSALWSIDLIAAMAARGYRIVERSRQNIFLERI